MPSRLFGKTFHLSIGATTGVCARLLLVTALLGGAMNLVARAHRNTDDATAPLVAVAAPTQIVPAPTQSSVRDVTPATSYRLAPQSLGRDSPLVHRARIAPQEICDAIGEGKMTWAASPVMRGEWECISKADRSKKGDEEPFLFAMARGPDKTEVGYVRIKLAAETEAASAEGAERLAAGLRRLFERLKWPMDEKAELSVRMLHPFDLDVEGVKIKLMKEVMRDGRYNLIATFPPGSVGSEIVERPFFLSTLDLKEAE